MAALTQSVAIDPYFFPALLAKGRVFERTGAHRRAAQTYKDLLVIVPPDDQLTPEIQQALHHARAVVDKNAASLDAFLQARLDGARSKHERAVLNRFTECKDIATGRRKIYT